MSILFNEKTRTFHLFNNEISYIMTVLPNEQMGQLYFGKRIHHKDDFSYLLETGYRPMTSYVFEGDRSFSLEHIRQEYGVYGTTDFRRPAVEVLQKTAAACPISAIRIILSRAENRSFPGFRPLTQRMTAKQKH